MKGSIYRDDRLMFNYELLDEDGSYNIGEIEFTPEEVAYLKHMDVMIREGQRLLKEKYDEWIEGE